MDEKTIAATCYLEGDARSQEPVVSADGRFLVFTSRARNLVPGGRGNGAHVYVRDMQRRTTRMVDLNENGSEANDDSVGPSVSADGQVIAFTSAASNLASGDNIADLSVFVRDLRRGTSERVSVSSEGLQANAMSFRATISADGRFVTFTSAASNLVPGDTQGRWGVYVRDRRLGITERVSVAFDGRDADDDSRGSSISADGRFIAFNSRATNLVPEVDEGTWHVYVRDGKLRTTERIDVSGDGAPADASSMGWSISSDGRFVAFTSPAKNLVPGRTTPRWRVFVRDRELARTELVSLGTDGQEADGPIHFLAHISPDGRFVAFTSRARNLAPGGAQGEWDVFVRDRRSMTTERLAVAMGGAESDGESAVDSVGSPISADGRFIAFTSAASNLVPGDTNDVQDAFVRDRGLRTTERVSVQGDQRDPPAPTAVAGSLASGHARTEGRSEMGSAADAGDVGLPTAMMDMPLSRRLNNDVWLCPEDVRLVNPLDGEPGEIRASGSVHVTVPFFTRNTYTFVKSRARVIWRGAHPSNVERIEQIETWSVDSHGGAVSIEDAPPGPASNGSGTVQRRTEVADTQASEQSWDRMVFLADGVGFRVRFKVAATFRFGSSTFAISAEDAALT